MSRTYRRRGQRHEYRWVLREWQWSGGALAPHQIDPRSKEGRRAIAATTNVGFGGDDWKTLYITTRNHLWAVNVNIPGVPVPVPARKK